MATVGFQIGAGDLSVVDIVIDASGEIAPASVETMRRRISTLINRDLRATYGQ